MASRYFSASGFIGQDRRAFHDAHPADLYVLSRRPSFIGTGSDTAAYAWWVWGPGRGGRYQVLACPSAREVAEVRRDRRTIQADRMLPVTEEGVRPTRQNAPLRSGGHRSPRRAVDQTGSSSPSARRRRRRRGRRRATRKRAPHRIWGRELQPGRGAPTRWRAGPAHRRGRPIGKLFRWKRDIGAGVRGQVRLFADRVVEIEKILVSGFHEVSVEISMDGLGAR